MVTVPTATGNNNYVLSNKHIYIHFYLYCEFSTTDDDQASSAMTIPSSNSDETYLAPPTDFEDQIVTTGELLDSIS